MKPLEVEKDIATLRFKIMSNSENGQIRDSAVFPGQPSENWSTNLLRK